MKNVKVVFDFTQLNVAEKIVFARNVITNMTSNPQFPNPPVTMEQLKTVTDSLEVRYIAAQNGGKQETALLHQALEEWEGLIRKIARYVDDVAEGDEAIIMSAGFSISKQRTPTQHAEFRVELGDKSGSVFLRRLSVVGAKAYIWQYCLDPLSGDESAWINAEVTTRASVTIEGLKPLTKYWFRVAVVTPNGTSEFCTPVLQAVI